MNFKTFVTAAFVITSAGAMAETTYPTEHMNDTVESLPAGSQGATRIGMINAEHSALSSAVDLTLPLDAGPEKSVAATKSFFSCPPMLLCAPRIWDSRD